MNFIMNKTAPNYLNMLYAISEDVLLKIKKLAFQLFIPSARWRNYVNELIINQIYIDVYE